MDEVVFGRYRLIAVIGEGGMGKVFKAHNSVIGRDVAVKVLPTELSTEPGYRERFRREALTAARLTEPHIIPIYEQLSQQYGAKLLWSGDWTTYDHPDYWVTIVPTTYPDSESVLNWCHSVGRDPDHCSAQIVSTTLGTDGPHADG